MQRVCWSFVMDLTSDKAYIPRYIHAWAELEERRRILRGIPLPGAWQPSLDPVQAARKLAKGRAKMIRDVSAYVETERAAIASEVEPPPGGKT